MNRVLKGLGLIILSAFIFNLNAYAQEKYVTYNKGDFLELYYNQENKELGNSKNDETRYNLIIENDNENNEYVKTLSLGVGRLGNGYSDSEGIDFTPTTFFSKTGPTPLHTMINKLKEDGFQDSKDENGNGPFWKDFSSDNSVSFITLEELIDVFDATDNKNGTYAIDINKKIGTNKTSIKTMFEYLANSIKEQADESNEVIKNYGIDWDMFKTGFYTGTIEGNKIYVAEFIFNNNDLTNIEIHLDDLPDTNPNNYVFYALVPTLHYKKATKQIEEIIDIDPKTDEEEACYLCNDEYIWQVDNNKCQLVKDITEKSKCVKPVETGLKDYIFELIIGISIAFIIYTSIKKYSLFKSI